MKRKRMAAMEIVVRYTTKSRIGAFLDHGTQKSVTTLSTCPAYDHPKMLEFVRHWRSIAVLNYVEFSLSYELSYLLRGESRTLKSHPTSVTSAVLHSPTPIDNRPGDVSPIVRAGSESGHWQDSRASKPRHDAGSTPASRS